MLSCWDVLRRTGDPPEQASDPTVTEDYNAESCFVVSSNLCT